MFKFTGLFVVASLACFSTLQAAEPVTAVVHAGTLLAVPGKAPLQRQSILLNNGRIVAVVEGFVDPATVGENVQMIDLADRFVMPGLMDMHVHITGQLSATSVSDPLTVTTSMKALRGAHYALSTLRAGFTTVRDLGGEPEAVYALRDSIRDGFLEGPRIFAAGSSLAATGGHGDVDGYKAELLQLWTPKTICDGPYECRKATRYAVKFGADWIKITATGGVLSDTSTGTDLQMTNDELLEIMQTAHALGVRVAAHAHGADGINAALRAGVDSIDHGTFLDDESIKLFREHGTYLVPTLSPGAKLPAVMANNPFFTEAIRAKADKAVAASATNFAKAYKAGVKIAFGTDSAVTPHGENADEFVLMVNAGMSEMDALYSATVATADLLQQTASLGTIEAGKIADIIAVPGNPLQDITAMKAVSFVMKNGKVVSTATQ